MSLAATRRVWEDQNVAGSARLLLLAIADCADHQGVAYPGVRYLCERTLFSRRRVQQLLQEILEAGHLIKTAHPGRSNFDCYQIRCCLEGEQPPSLLSVSISETSGSEVSAEYLAPSAENNAQSFTHSAIKGAEDCALSDVPNAQSFTHSAIKGAESFTLSSDSPAQNITHSKGERVTLSTQRVQPLTERVQLLGQKGATLSHTHGDPKTNNNYNQRQANARLSSSQTERCAAESASETQTPSIATTRRQFSMENVWRIRQEREAEANSSARDVSNENRLVTAGSDAPGHIEPCEHPELPEYEPSELRRVDMGDRFSAVEAAKSGEDDFRTCSAIPKERDETEKRSSSAPEDAKLEFTERVQFRPEWVRQRIEAMQVDADNRTSNAGEWSPVTDNRSPSALKPDIAPPASVEPLKNHQLNHQENQKSVLSTTLASIDSTVVAEQVDRLQSESPPLQTSAATRTRSGFADAVRKVVGEVDAARESIQEKKRQSFFRVVAWVLGWDVDSLTETQRGTVAQTLGHLSHAGFTEGDVRRFWREVWVKDARWTDNRERPTSRQMYLEIFRFRAESTLPEEAVHEISAPASTLGHIGVHSKSIDAPINDADSSARLAREWTTPSGLQGERDEYLEYGDEESEFWDDG